MDPTPSEAGVLKAEKYSLIQKLYMLMPEIQAPVTMGTVLSSPAELGQPWLLQWCPKNPMCMIWLGGFLSV